MEEVKNQKRNVVAMSLVSILFGILFLGFPGMVAAVIGYTTGAALLIKGIMDIYAYFKLKEESVYSSKFIIGVGLALLGAYILIRPGFVVSILPVFFGFAIIVNGLTTIRLGIDMKKKESAKWHWSVISGAIIVILGIIILFNPFATSLILFMYIGIFMIVSAILNIVHLVFVKTTK